MPYFTPLFNDPEEVMIMAAVNLSPESFYKGSVAKEEVLKETMIRLKAEGADVIDFGAMSTAPYLETAISEEEETERISKALIYRPDSFGIPMSVDTSRRMPAEYALRNVCCILNDVTGCEHDEGLLSIAKHYRANVILMAHESQMEPGRISQDQSPERIIFSCLKRIRDRALDHGIEEERIILDPGIGFFRNQRVPWYEFDMQILRNLPLLRELGHPLLVSVSRKSFLGHLLEREKPEDRLAGSLAATMMAIEYGAQIIRTHDVAATRDVIKYRKLLKQEMAT